MCENLQKLLEIKYDRIWDQFKTEVYNVRVEVLNPQKIKHQDQLDEKYPQITKLLEDKSILHQKYLSPSDEKQNCWLKSSLQCKLNQTKNQ